MTYDAIVIGLGGMGSATAADAALRGLRVLGLERFGPVHDRGSSAGRSRIIRKAYFEDPAYVPLVRRAFERWHDLELVTGSDILRITGVLLVGMPRHASVRNARASALLHELPFDELDAVAIRKRYPRLAPYRDEIGIFERDAGLLVPETAIAAHLELAQRAGAELRFHAPVRSWRDGPAGSIEVELEDGSTYMTRRLALCMGPWFEDAARAIGIPLAIERRVQHWFAPGTAGYGPDDIPTFLIDRDEQPSRMYGFPDLGDGLKAAFHGVGVVTHADDLDRVVAEADIAPVRRALEAWIPGSTARYLGGKVCMYSLTPDEHFVLGLYPGDPRIVLAGGFSGHGFKFASVIGEIITDLLADGATPHDIGFLSPARFERLPVER